MILFSFGVSLTVWMLMLMNILGPAFARVGCPCDDFEIVETMTSIQSDVGSVELSAVPNDVRLDA